MTFCEYCQEEKTLHETVKFSGVKRPFCSEGTFFFFFFPLDESLSTGPWLEQHCSLKADAISGQFRGTIQVSIAGGEKNSFFHKCINWSWSRMIFTTLMNTVQQAFSNLFVDRLFCSEGVNLATPLNIIQLSKYSAHYLNVHNNIVGKYWRELSIFQFGRNTHTFLFFFSWRFWLHPYKSKTLITTKLFFFFLCVFL